MSQILGIHFADSPVDTLVEQALKGGLVVVPSGPGLAVDLLKSDSYREAVTQADLAIADSGAMALFMKLFHRKKIHRVSGLHFLQKLLAHDALKPVGSTFWVHPNAEQMETNTNWLKEADVNVASEDNYIAPIYPAASIGDRPLIDQLKTRSPKVIVLCIGGGIQERLGLWLREQYKDLERPCPAIVCTGAAIGFLSGNQVNIPTWADRMFLGWLFRCIYEPRKFIPRYWNALPLAYLIAKYGEKIPPMKNGDTLQD